MSRWLQKFRYAFRGLAVGVRTQDSFLIHLPAGVLALGLAGWLGMSSAEWALLVLSICLVLCLELVNSAIESLAKGLTSDQNPMVGQALDIAAGATLLAALGAVVVGLLLFAPKVWSVWHAALPPV
jgi:diacylglycerol kinase (ATP)